MLQRKLLKGENVRLSTFNDSDIQLVQSWFEDADFMRNFSLVPSDPKPPQVIGQFIQGALEAGNRYLFSVRIKSTDEVIGAIELKDISWNNGYCEIGIGIGNPEHRGKGYGKEAMKLALDFVFSELNLYRIHLLTFDYNLSAIKLYESLGFVKEGVYRNMVHRDGKRFDMYLYGLLRDEWTC